jgi:SNF2 family DNA or RNA helicase
MISLYSSQKRGAQELLAGKRAIFLPYGGGKTRLSLMFADLFRRRKEGQPLHVVVLCKPRNVITWRREVAKFVKAMQEEDPSYPNIEFFDFRGDMYHCESVSHTIVAKGSINPYNYVVAVPYSLVTRNFGFLSSFILTNYTTALIADESTKFKNPKADITKKMLRLADVMSPYNIPRVILTGNPAPEGPQEIWAQQYFCYRDKFLPETYYGFLNRWFIKSQYGYTIKHDCIPTFQSFIAHISVHLKPEDYDAFRREANYPTPQFVIENYELTSRQEDLLEELYTDWAIASQENAEANMEFKYIIALLNKAQQICSGMYYYKHMKETKELVYPEGEDSFCSPVLKEERLVQEIVALKDNPKAQLASQIIADLIAERRDQKIIVWYKYNFERSLLSDLLEAYQPLLGPDEDALEAFMADPTKRIILMPVDCSEGFNELLVASVDIYFSNSFSISARKQAEARIDRPGQKSDTVVHIDLSSSDARDAEVIAAIQSKDLSPERLRTIVRKHCRVDAF